jgi:hypothetical protein
VTNERSVGLGEKRNYPASEEYDTGNCARMLSVVGFLREPALRSAIQSEVTQGDWAEFQRLCQPESRDFILNLPDYYPFLSYSLFHGKVRE